MIMKRISLKHKKKVALVVSGGAVKAACFHVGVCLALERKGIQFTGGIKGKSRKNRREFPLTINTYVGSSSGAIIAAFLASGYSLESIIDSFLERSNQKSKYSVPKLHYRDLFHLAKPNLAKYFRFLQKDIPRMAMGSLEAFFKNHLSFGGIFTTQGIERYLRTRALVTNNFEDLSSDLFIVSTQLDYPFKTIFCNKKWLKPNPDHHAIYENSISISEAAAASTALPPIYQPYPIKIEDKTIYHYDGEIRETLSTHVAKDNGCDLIIASYTHEPYHFHPAVGSLAQYGISSVVIQSIYQAIEQKIHTSQRLFKTKRIALNVVHEFFKENKLPEQKRRELCEMLETKLNYDKNLDYIFISPRPQDYRLFLADHFNLSTAHMRHIVNSGFKSALACLRNYDFS